MQGRQQLGCMFLGGCGEAAGTRKQFEQKQMVGVMHDGRDRQIAVFVQVAEHGRFPLQHRRSRSIHFGDQGQTIGQRHAIDLSHIAAVQGVDGARRNAEILGNLLGEVEGCRSNAVSQEGAGHAVAATSALAQFEAIDFDHFDSGVAQGLVGVGVFAVSDDHARFQGNGVVSIIPLFPDLLVAIPTGGNDPQLSDPQRILHCIQKTRFLGDIELVWFIAGAQAVSPDAVSDGRVDGDGISIEHGEDGIEVHVRPVPGHLAGDDTFDSSILRTRIWPLAPPFGRWSVRSCR